jgi:hypothetical protein
MSDYVEEGGSVRLGELVHDGADFVFALRIRWKIGNVWSAACVTRHPGRIILISPSHPWPVAAARTPRTI